MPRKHRYQWNVDAPDAAAELPSRSQKKRDSTALQKLGEELTRLTPAQLARLPLTPELNEALRLMTRITDHEGRRRQLQYIGRCMRDADAEALRAALNGLRQAHTKETAAFHRAERLREALLAASPETLDALLESWADAPETREMLRRLVREAQAEQAAHRPPRAARELLRRIRESEI